MAYILQRKPLYRPRGAVSLYMLDGRLMARAWRSPRPDPKTARQLAQRNRFACASLFLKHFTPLVSRGYKSGEKPNGRRIGAYHMALSEIMRNSTRHQRNTWRVDCSTVRLATGWAFPLQGIETQRRGGRLVLQWRACSSPQVATLRVALYDGKQRAIVAKPEQLHSRAKQIEVQIPKGMGAKRLHIWIVLEDEMGKILWESHYTTVDATSSPTPTSGSVGVESSSTPQAKRFESGDPKG